jgi:energy-converting hydrogenase Eha subunit G
MGWVLVKIANPWDPYDGLHGSVIASTSSAMTLAFSKHARYSFAGAFLLFISKSKIMYYPTSPGRTDSNVNILNSYDSIALAWAISLFGFVTLFLLPISWVLYRYSPRIEAKSRYPTIKY